MCSRPISTHFLRKGYGYFLNLENNYAKIAAGVKEKPAFTFAVAFLRKAKPHFLAVMLACVS